MTPDRLTAAVYDPFLWLGERAGMARARAGLLASANGRVLEIGAGTGLNLRHYPDAVDELVLTEPVEAMARKLERRARRRGIDADVVRAPADRLPFADASFDTVVSTLVLCTVDHPGHALAELRRVLRPGGRLLFIEHVRADAPRLARWQDRLERPWCAFAAGCRANRSTVEAIARAGLTLDRLERGRWRGMPPIVAPLAIGAATT
jgi:ubiquinone/menaquinone biosynthesis C-methylase UbiE